MDFNFSGLSFIKLTPCLISLRQLTRNPRLILTRFPNLLPALNYLANPCAASTKSPSQKRNVRLLYALPSREKSALASASVHPYLHLQKNLSDFAAGALQFSLPVQHKRGATKDHRAPLSLYDCLAHRSCREGSKNVPLLSMSSPNTTNEALSWAPPSFLADTLSPTTKRAFIPNPFFFQARLVLLN